MTITAQELAYNIYILRKLQIPKGEMVDIGIKTTETLLGYEHARMVQEYGISFPILKTKNELRHITNNTKDDKTSKRKHRFNILEYSDKCVILQRFYSAFCNIFNGGDGNSQHPAHIVFTASGGNLVTFFVKLIINIYDVITQYGFFNDLLKNELLAYNKVILEALCRIYRGYTISIIIRQIYNCFNTPEGQAHLINFRQILGGDSDFTLSLNKEPEEDLKRKQNRAKDQTAKDQTAGSQSGGGSKPDLKQFCVGRIKGATLCDRYDEYTLSDQELTNMKKYEKEINTACIRTIQSNKEMFEKINLDVATVYNMYPSLIQQQYVDVVRDLLDRKNVDKYKKCLKFLSSLKQIKDNNEAATKHNVSVTSKFYGASFRDSTDALMFHTINYTQNINKYIEQWLNGELDANHAPAFHMIPSRKPRTYEELSMCFESIENIMTLYDNLLVSLLSDIIHYILTEESVFHTRDLLTAINEAYRTTREDCRNPTMQIATMNYTDDIPELIGELFKTTLPQYPPGAQIIIMSVNEQESTSTSVPMTIEDSSVPMITEDSSVPMTEEELELGSFPIPEIPQNIYFENKENPHIDIFDLHERDDKNHYYNNYDTDMLANLPEINPLAPPIFARPFHLPQEPFVSGLPVAPLVAPHVAPLVAQPDAQPDASPVASFAEQASKLGLSIASFNPEFAPGPPFKYIGGKKKSYKKKIKTKNYKKSNKSKKTRTMRRNQQKSRKVNKANKSRKQRKSRKVRKVRKSRKVRKYKV